MDTSPVTPYKISPSDGGIVDVIRPPIARIAAVNPFEYPFFSMSGPRIRLSIAASAVADPEIPPIRQDNNTDTCASPPRICPVARLQNLISLDVIPVSFIKFPASTKKGTANKEKDCVLDTIF